MERLVVDSSVAVKWFVEEPYSAEARQILDGYENGQLIFCAPDLLNAEFGNIVWKKQTFQGLSSTDALAVLDAFRKLEFSFTSSATLLETAYASAVKHKITVYDALYLALSVRENCPIVTADERLVNAVGKDFPKLVWIADWE